MYVCMVSEYWQNGLSCVLEIDNIILIQIWVGYDKVFLDTFTVMEGSRSVCMYFDDRFVHVLVMHLWKKGNASNIMKTIWQQLLSEFYRIKIEKYQMD